MLIPKECYIAFFYFMCQSAYGIYIGDNDMTQKVKKCNNAFFYLRVSTHHIQLNTKQTTKTPVYNKTIQCRLDSLFVVYNTVML